MYTQSALRLALFCGVALLSLSMVFFSPATFAQSNSSNFVFLLASGFLCNPDDSSACPAVAKANEGDSYELSGAGTFDAQNKSVKAAGTYTHKSPNGNVLETGVWLANELVSFDSYGIAPNAIPSQAKGLGPGVMGAKHMPMMNRGPMPTGGLAVFRIVMLSVAGVSTTAVLQANCALGDVPHERSVEGIRVTLERNNMEFSEELGGRVMFLAMRPEASAPVQPKTPQEGPAPESSGQPQN